MLPYDSVGAPLVGVLRDLHVDEDKIQQLVGLLTKQDLESAVKSFATNARIPVSSFGGSPVGHELGDHHNRAQQVFDETIRGITKDLENFRDAVKFAEGAVTEADQSSADDMTRRHQAVQAMQNVWANSEGDRRHNWARNHPGQHDYDGAQGSEGGDS